MENNFEQDTDQVIQVVHRSNVQREAEARARFALAVEAEAAKYRCYRARVHKRFYALSQFCMILTGVYGLVAGYLCLQGGGWSSLVFVFATIGTYVLGLWCSKKSRRK